MMPALSPNTQAILLLTAPLIVGRDRASPDLLSPGEYKRLALHLRAIQRQPADLIGPGTPEVLRACQPVIEADRLQRLLARGFLLSQAIEFWQARAIWVISRADAEYPHRLKSRLREDAPAVLYGCGDMALLENGGLAVVGSRHVDDALMDYTMSIGQLAARAGSTVVSGGAKGIDQAAMHGALEAGGKVCGVLADSMAKAAMNPEHRRLLLEKQLLLVSPYDPSAGFNVGNAMQRNKLIYALADASLVVNSDVNKGGTWAGAVEQLDKLKFIPVFVRSTGAPSAGLDALRGKGALPWPNPQDADAFAKVFDVPRLTAAISPQVGCSLLDTTPQSNTSSKVSEDTMQATAVDRITIDSDMQLLAGTSEKSAPVALNSETPPNAIVKLQPEMSPSELVFSAVRRSIQQILTSPMKDFEVAAVLDVSKEQAKAWLQRLVVEGRVEKLHKPVRYLLKSQTSLFADELLNNS